MTRVYAIRTGSYSDTSWGPVFSTVEKAMAYQKGYRGEDGCHIECHVLDDEVDTGLVYPCWLIVFDKDGNVIFHHQQTVPLLYEPLLHDRSYSVFPNKPGLLRHILDVGDLREQAALIVSGVSAPDLAHAVKIAADIRAQYLSEH